MEGFQLFTYRLVLKKDTVYRPKLLEQVRKEFLNV